MDFRPSAHGSSNVAKLHGVKLKNRASRKLDHASPQAPTTPLRNHGSDSSIHTELSSASIASPEDGALNPISMDHTALLHLKLQTLEDTVSMQQQHIFELVQQLDREIELSRNLKVMIGIDKHPSVDFSLHQNHSVDEQLLVTNRNSRQSQAIRDHIYQSASHSLNAPITFSEMALQCPLPASSPQSSSNRYSRSISTEFIAQSSAVVEPPHSSHAYQADRDALSEVEMTLAACVESYSDQIESYSAHCVSLEEEVRSLRLKCSELSAQLNQQRQWPHQGQHSLPLQLDTDSIEIQRSKARLQELLVEAQQLRNSFAAKESLHNAMKEKLEASALEIAGLQQHIAQLVVDATHSKDSSQREFQLAKVAFEQEIESLHRIVSQQSSVIQSLVRQTSPSYSSSPPSNCRTDQALTSKLNGAISSFQSNSLYRPSFETIADALHCFLDLIVECSDALISSRREVNNLTVSDSKHQDAIKHLTIRIAFLESENGNLELRNSSLLSEFTELSSLQQNSERKYAAQIEHMQKSLSQRDSDAARLITVNEDYTQKMVSLQDILIAERQIFREELKQIHDHGAKEQSLEEAIGELEAEIVDLERARDDCQQRIAELEGGHAALSVELAGSRAETERMRVSLADATSQEAHVRSQTKELVEKLRTKLQAVTESEAVGKARVAELESALAGVGSETTLQLDSLRKELAESEASCGEYMQRCDIAQAKLHEVQAEMQSASSASSVHVAELEAKLKEADAAHAAACLEHGAKEQSLEEAIGELEAEIVDLERARFRIVELEAALAAVGSESIKDLDPLQERLVQSNLCGNSINVNLESARAEISQSPSNLSKFRSSLLLSSALCGLDDCIRHFQELIPMLSSFSVFRLEVITPLRSFVSDKSDQTLSYSDIAECNGAQRFVSLNSQFMHAFVCEDMQVCLLCHYSSPSMLHPLSALLDLAFSRLHCAQFAVLSFLEPQAPLLSRAVTLSVDAIEVRPAFHQCSANCLNNFFICRAISTLRMRYSDLPKLMRLLSSCLSALLFIHFCVQ